MSLMRLQPLGCLPMSLTDVKRRINVEHNEDNGLIEGYLATAVAHLDGDRGWLGRAVITQKWKLTLVAFPGSCGRIMLPLPPLISVDAVAYTDTDGEVQALTAGTDYTVINQGGAASYIIPAFGKVWPTSRIYPDAVSVSFTAGYGDDPINMEWFAIAAAIGLMVGDLYANKETVADGLTEIPMSMTVQNLLEPLRIGGVG